MNSYKIGLLSEFIAYAYLRLHGFKVLKHRYITGRYTGRAEIDIIAKRGNLLVFIEVKHRHDITVGLDSVTPAQATRLRRAAETYIINHNWTGDARFDIIVVESIYKIRWIRGAI